MQKFVKKCFLSRQIQLFHKKTQFFLVTLLFRLDVKKRTEILESPGPGFVALGGEITLTCRTSIDSSLGMITDLFERLLKYLFKKRFILFLNQNR